MLHRCVLTILTALSATLPLHAVVVRGRVTSAEGVPQPGARVQLIRLTGGSRSVADTVAGLDGSFDLRSDLGGRFLLLVSPSLAVTGFAPQIGRPFYAGRTDLLTRNIALDRTNVFQQESATLSGNPTPLAQLSTPVFQVRPDALLTQATILPDLPQTPGLVVTQFGPAGAPALLYLRGAPPSATQITLDDQPIEPLGGGFNLATLSTTGLAALTTAPALELVPTALPVNALDAEAGVLLLHTASASTTRPALTYSGDAGPLATLRNELLLTAALTRADLAAGFSRFDTTSSGDAATPRSPFHLATAFANVGYHLSAGTSLRVIARRDVSAALQALPFDFYKLQPSDKESQQNSYATLQFETVTSRNWTNRLAYALTRERAQFSTFSTPSIGLPVTITGANGYTVNGTALFSPRPSREDLVSNRDVVTYQTGIPFKLWLMPLFQARYQDERGADLLAGARQTVSRHHFSVALSLQGELHHRIFYEASGFLDYGSLLHAVGGPRLGLTYIPVRPGPRRFRGTALHLTIADGSREPSLAEQASLVQAAAPHARTIDLSINQSLLAKVKLQATYFHNQFSREAEPIASLYPAIRYDQNLALRTQGFEGVLSYQPSPRLVLHGSYTYLAALTERSSAVALINPVFPLIPIGVITALTGARPFHRPPNSGSAQIEYTGLRLSASFQAAVSGRSDDSTGLLATPTLLLPNRNLSPGYTALDANITYAFSHRITAYTQMTNLLDNHHMAPLGYTSAPFLIRTGLRIRIGGE